MRHYPFLAVPVFLLALSHNLTAQQSVSAACVDRTTGISRFVESAASCTSGERSNPVNLQVIAAQQQPAAPAEPHHQTAALGILTPVAQPGPVLLNGKTGPMGPQGPAGPTGPTGPQGPQGAPGFGALATGSFVPVPATDDYLANGLALVNAVKNFYAAYGYDSVVFQLGAGTYTLPSTLTLYPGYSLQGAGMVSTIVQNACATCTNAGTLQLTNSSDIAVDQSLSNLTVTGDGGPALDGAPVNLLLLDHVRLADGYGAGLAVIPTTASHASTLTTGGAGHVLILDSVLGYVHLVQSGAQTTPNVIQATEIEPGLAPAGIVPAGNNQPAYLCSGAYSLVTPRLLGANCQ